jgi:hypothetical protein
MAVSPLAPDGGEPAPQGPAFSHPDTRHFRNFTIEPFAAAGMITKIFPFVNDFRRISGKSFTIMVACSWR